MAQEDLTTHRTGGPLFIGSDNGDIGLDYSQDSYNINVQTTSELLC